MKYIVQALKLLNKINSIFNWNINIYSELVRNLRHLESAELTVSLRKEIISFLESLEIQYLKLNIAHILCPDIPSNEFDEEYVTARKLSDLNDVQLLNYLGVVIWTVSINEKDDMLLVKYNQCIFNTGWHNLAKECRGKIIDRNTFDVISYPFDKFFNLGEADESSEENVKKYISNARKIYVTDKKDGSTIIVSNYKGSVIITTNGAFDNIQIEMAKEIFDEKYNKFYNNIPEGFTYIFELIHPENKIVLDYGDDKKLYLLTIRDVKTYKLLPFEAVSDFAKEYDLDLVESESFVNLDQMVNLARDMKDANKEGWVLRLLGDDFDFMFKLKLQEYFLLHRSMSSVSIKKVYTLIQAQEIENFLNTVDDETKEEVLGMIEEINIARTNIKDEVIRLAEELLNKYGATREQFLTNKDILVPVIHEAFKLPQGGFIVKYLKNPEGLDYSISKIPTKKFLKHFEE